MSRLFYQVVYFVAQRCVGRLEEGEIQRGWSGLSGLLEKVGSVLGIKYWIQSEYLVARRAGRPGKPQSGKTRVAEEKERFVRDLVSWEQVVYERLYEASK